MPGDDQDRRRSPRPDPKLGLKAFAFVIAYRVRLSTTILSVIERS